LAETIGNVPFRRSELLRLNAKMNLSIFPHTPVSRNQEIFLVSPLNILNRVRGATANTSSQAQTHG
jgi:hypothetical protein